MITLITRSDTYQLIVHNSACLRRLECPLDALEVQQDSLCVGVGLPAAGRAPAEGPRVVVRLLLGGGGLRCVVGLHAGGTSDEFFS